MMRCQWRARWSTGAAHSEFTVHPLFIGLVALLIALVVASVVVFHRRAKALLAGHDPIAADSDAMLTALMAESRASH
jgi:hypothetical protein